MPSEKVMRNLETVRSALDRKGFSGLFVTHYDNTPVDYMVLHDDHGQVARGDRDEVMRAIEEADDVDRLWSALDRANLTRGSLAGKS
jgi:hypothetical protein